MTSKLGQEPAFPQAPHREAGMANLDSLGLTKREWFAGMAMMGIVANSDTKGTNETLFDLVAGTAFKLADAMLKERDK